MNPKLRKRISNIVGVLSQAFNTIFLNGNPNMTFGARCYLNRNEPYWKPWFTFLNRATKDPDHCKKCYAEDIEYGRLVVFELESIKNEPTEVLINDDI